MKIEMIRPTYIDNHLYSPGDVVDVTRQKSLGRELVWCRRAKEVVAPEEPQTDAVEPAPKSGRKPKS